MPSHTVERFTAFYNGWLIRLEQLQQELSAAVISKNIKKHQQVESLIQQVCDHYRQYYEKKAGAMEDDVFLICSPPWYTSFEQALFWVTGFPPTLVFRFASGLGMTLEQAEWVERVRLETVEKERGIAEAMAMLQETVAAAPMYGLVNRAGTLVDGELSQLDEAMNQAKEAMRALVTQADALRGTAVMEIIKVLGVMQRLNLFAALGEFRIQARRLGLQMDTARGLTL